MIFCFSISIVYHTKQASFDFHSKVKMISASRRIFLLSFNKKMSFELAKQKIQKSKEINKATSRQKANPPTRVQGSTNSGKGASHGQLHGKKISKSKKTFFRALAP